MPTGTDGESKRCMHRFGDDSRQTRADAPNANDDGRGRGMVAEKPHRGIAIEFGVHTIKGVSFGLADGQFIRQPDTAEIDFVVDLRAERVSHGRLELTFENQPFLGRPPRAQSLPGRPLCRQYLRDRRRRSRVTLDAHNGASSQHKIRRIHSRPWEETCNAVEHPCVQE